jgi:hypothetical protein
MTADSELFAMRSLPSNLSYFHSDGGFQQAFRCLCLHLKFRRYHSDSWALICSFRHEDQIIYNPRMKLPCVSCVYIPMYGLVVDNLTEGRDQKFVCAEAAAISDAAVLLSTHSSREAVPLTREHMRVFRLV